MNNRRWWILLAIACLSIPTVYMVARLRRNPPLWFCIHVPGVREVPQQSIRRAFRFSTGGELPPRADAMQAVFSGGLDPGIFLRFRTDASGIEYILDAFAGPDVKDTTFGPDGVAMPSGWHRKWLGVASQWEEEAGLQIWDQNSIDSARVLESIPKQGASDGYQVLIDEETMTVYIFAFHI